MKTAYHLASAKLMEKGHLYLAVIDRETCKIGISKNPKKRIAQISGTQPHKATLVKSWPKAASFERAIHQAMAPLQKRGEWFGCEPVFAQWICEMVMAGDAAKAAIAATHYRQHSVAAAKACWPEMRRADRELYDLGFETLGHRIMRNTIAGLNERRR